MSESDFPRRKSTEESLPYRITKTLTGTKSSDPNDFDDVFGGPPRTVTSRNSSGYFNRTSLFYEDIFRQPGRMPTSTKSGRSLPAFRIPLKRNGDQSEDFYSDIFGSDDNVRFSSKSNTKSTSLSVLSSEDIRPFRPVKANGDDPALNVFASKLRPIYVPSRWNSSIGMPKDRPEKPMWMPALFQTNPNSKINNQFVESCYNDSAKSGFSRQVPSPESISVDQNLFGSGKVSGNETAEINSPLSGISSVFNAMQDKERVAADEDDEDDEVMSSYVIEINSDHRCEQAISVDDAIAWAKERKHQCGYVPAPRGMSLLSNEVQLPICAGTASVNGILVRKTVGEKEPHSPIKVDTKTELLDEDIRGWSTGKEANIRFLLSTLDHILWQNSGWCATPILSLIETHCVKKAYQKARLCLHPDKLQQRGATSPQKYIAEKAFSILQDAWAVFLTQNNF